MRKCLGLLLVGFIGVSLTACAGPMAKQGMMGGMALGALGGYSATGNSLGAAGGAAAGGFLGLVGGSIADMFGSKVEAEARQAAAMARAQGTTSCTRQERWESGRLVVDQMNCNSAMERGGFRGDPMPPTAPVPAVRYEPAQVVIKAYPAEVVMPVPTTPPPPPIAPSVPPRPM